MDMNKWNPSDIWIRDSKFTKQTLTLATKNMNSGIQEFNAMLTKAFEQKQLIGVSLKKIGNTRTWPQTTTISTIKNEVSSLAKGKDIVYKGPTDSVKKIQQSMAINFSCEGNLGELQFRNFSGSPTRNSFQGNITKMAGQSGAALHGKVGIWRVFMDESGAPKHFKTEHGHYVDASKLPAVNEKYADAMKNNRFTTEMRLYMMVYNKLNGTTHTNVEFFDMWKSAKQGYDFCSNLLGLQVIDCIENHMNEDAKKSFLEGIVLFAMSQIPNVSSIFTKNK